MTHKHDHSTLRSVRNTLRIFRGIFLILFATVATCSSPGQQFATLKVTVVDPSGRLVAQAKVSARKTDTGIVRDAASDKSGNVVIPGLSAGQYTLTVDADAFAPYEVPLLLTLGQIADVQVLLHIAGTTEQVKVTASTQGIDRERTVGSQVINPKQISNLPISDRNFVDFVLLTPTATVWRNTSTRRPIGLSGISTSSQLRRIARDPQRAL